MTAPFGIQIVVYLFLAGLAAGSALFASKNLLESGGEKRATGRRALSLALIAIGLGIVCLIFDLSDPGGFFLILTNANPTSAIAWGARMVTAFLLVALYCRVAVRGDLTLTIIDRAALGLLCGLAMGLAIYPGFVLMQGEGVALWNSWLVVPLIALSGLHAGWSASRLLSPSAAAPGSALDRLVTLAVGAFLIVLLVSSQSFTVLALLALLLSAVLPSLLRGKAVVSALSVLAGCLVIRAWLIQDGQNLFF